MKGFGTMELIPAIDLRDGRCVRLLKGDFSAETVYSDDPQSVLDGYRALGARRVHIVDLDGARTGSPKSLAHLERITHELRVPVQYGGGLRDVGAVRGALAAGADRVILGTAAYNDIEFLDEALATWDVRIVVAIDVRDGHVSVSGWTEKTQMLAENVIQRMQGRGVKQFVYTNVDRDGMLEGPDLDEVGRIADVIRGRFLYSGGIGSLDDLRALKGLRLVNLAGVISGKALYERRFAVAEGNAVLTESG